MKKSIFLILTILSFYLLSCNKLGVKPSQSLVVPSTLQDFQGLMDNATVLNTNYCSLGEKSADNYYMVSTVYQALATAQDKNAYIWNKATFAGITFEPDWEYSYSNVFYCNVVLDGLPNIQISDNNRSDYNNVKGQALFHRANAFFMLSQEFANPYSAATSSSDLGVVLRLTSDLNVKSQRVTVKETYDRVIGDLLTAKGLLPTTALYKTRPSKAACFALLSRVYLSKEDYTNALLNADSCLQLYNTLINYNTLSASTTFPFTLFNNEVLLHGTLTNSVALTQTSAIIDSVLYRSYSSNDLRKTLFFKDNGNNTVAFRGNYNGNARPNFGGIATDEVYLIRAECYARTANTTAAMQDLNTLLNNRFKTGTFTPLTAINADDALSKILTERRKELLFRGLRWTDLRRLNKDTRFATTLYRQLGSQNYSLQPNDPRYTLPIPDYIAAISGITQNP